MPRLSLPFVVALVFGCLSLAVGQPKPPKLFQAGPFDDFAHGMVMRPDVQKELKVTTEQKANFRGRGGRLATAFVAVAVAWRRSRGSFERSSSRS